MINYIKKFSESGYNIKNIRYTSNVSDNINIIYLMELVKKYFSEMFKQKHFAVLDMIVVSKKIRKKDCFTTTSLIKKRYVSNGCYFLKNKFETCEVHPSFFVSAIIDDKATIIKSNLTHSSYTDGKNEFYVLVLGPTEKKEATYVAINKLIYSNYTVLNINKFFNKFFNISDYIDKNTGKKLELLKFNNEIIQRINSVVEAKYNKKIFIDYTLVNKLHFFENLFKNVVNIQEIKNQNQMQNHVQSKILNSIQKSINKDYIKAFSYLKEAIFLFPKNEDLEKFLKSSQYIYISNLLLLNKYKNITFDLTVKQKTNKDKMIILCHLEYIKYIGGEDKDINCAIKSLLKGKVITPKNKQILLAYFKKNDKINLTKIDKNNSNDDNFFV